MKVKYGDTGKPCRGKTDEEFRTRTDRVQMRFQTDNDAVCSRVECSRQCRNEHYMAIQTKAPKSVGLANGMSKGIARGLQRDSRGIA